ncbi:MAG: HAD family hydrolase [Sedimentisphaerales bacterium]|nr:HAD family hydrolase [Sedimentisphaerales bacterium]
MIKAAIFDLGDTIFNYGRFNSSRVFEDGAQASFELLRQYNGGRSPCPYIWYWFSHSISIRLHYIISHFTQKEFDCPRILRRKAWRLGVVLGDDQLLALTAKWYEPLRKTAAVEPDIRKTMLRLKEEHGLKLAIISNTFIPGEVLEQHLDQFGLTELFEVRVYSCDTICRKPDIRIYERALKELGLPGSEVIMVGDRIKEDVAGPGRLGIRGIIKLGATNLHKNYPRNLLKVRSLSELPEIVKYLNNKEHTQK